MITGNFKNLLRYFCSRKAYESMINSGIKDDISGCNSVRKAECKHKFKRIRRDVKFMGAKGNLFNVFL